MKPAHFYNILFAKLAQNFDSFFPIFGAGKNYRSGSQDGSDSDACIWIFSLQISPNRRNTEYFLIFQIPPENLLEKENLSLVSVSKWEIQEEMKL